MNYEFNLLHHVSVVAKRVCAAAAAETVHEREDNTPSGHTPSGPTGRGVKIAINRPLKFFFSAIIEIVRELVISNMHNKFGIHDKLFKVKLMT